MINISKITDKQKIFVDEYLIDLNGTRAYRKAYPNCKSDNTAGASACRLLKNSNVQKYIEKRMKDRERRTEITQDMVINELAKVAFSNGTDFMKVVDKSVKVPIKDESGNVIDEREEKVQAVEVINTDNIEEDKRNAIASIKQNKYGISIECYDKMKALELLGKHLGIFKDTVEIQGNINNPYESLTKEELLEIVKN